MFIHNIIYSLSLIITKKNISLFFNKVFNYQKKKKKLYSPQNKF